MKWYWIVVWRKPTGTSDGEDVGEIRSLPFNSEAEALLNLQARLNQSKPDIPLPKGAYISTYMTELK